MVLGWITARPLRSRRRLLENLPDPPPLLPGQGPSLLDQHAVADLARVGLIVSLELLRPPHDPFVARVAVDALDQDHAGLGHLVAHHHALSRLLHVRYVLSSPNTGARAVATPVPRRILALACSFTPRLAAGYRLRPMFSSRSLRTVFARPRSRRAWPTRAGFLATPIASWSLRLKSSSVRSLTFCSRSSVSISRHVVGFMPASERPRPRHELGLDADLLRGQPEPLARGGLVHTLHLVENAPGLDHGHPELRVPLALAHPSLGGLLGHRLVGEDPDEDLAAPLDAAREGYPGCFDLPVRHPPGLERLEPKVAEGQRGAALGQALHATALGLAILDALRHQHGLASRRNALARAMRRVQLQGGARGPHARRTPCTLSVRPRAPTPQMGPYHRSRPRRSAGRAGPRP